LEAPRKSDREDDDPRLDGVGVEEGRPWLPLPRRRRRRRSRLLRRRLRPFFFGSTYSASDSSGIVEAGADEIAKAKRIAFLASRTNTMLSIPMLMSMLAPTHGFFL